MAHHPVYKSARIRRTYITNVPLMRGASVSAETMVRTYPNPDAYQRDARKLAGKGWSVSNTMERKPRAGCARILTLGLFTMLFPPKPEIVVTYVRQRR